MKPGWQTARCPLAEWVPWKYPAGAPESAVGQPTYYANANKPIATVLHVMQGYQRTARQWAESGFYPKSWHFSIGRDGSAMQHLEFRHGGYHAGITRAVAELRPPTWNLWRGPNVNVNTYVVGIEHEGFSGQPFTPEQTETSIAICLWIADQLEVPVDIDHFPPHAFIDTRDRANDFNIPGLRAAHYAQLLAAGNTEDDMTPAEVQAMIDAALAKQEAEFVAAVGSTPIRNAQALTKRMFAIHDVTDPAKIPGE